MTPRPAHHLAPALHRGLGQPALRTHRLTGPRNPWRFAIVLIWLIWLGACDGGVSPWLGDVHASAGGDASYGRAATKEAGGMDPAEPEDRRKEYKVKAALLFNFLKYATFPPGTFPNDKSPIKVLIVGHDPFGAILKKLLGKKKIDGRSIQISRVASTPKEIEAQLVFASGLDENARAGLIEKLKDKPSLLVGEEPGFARSGGFINLYMDKAKVRFEINSSRQSSTGVKLHAELLKLARIIKSDGGLSR